MAKYVSIVFLLLSFSGWAQSGENDRFPQFPACEKMTFQQEEPCFKRNLIKFVRTHFQFPSELKKPNYRGEMVVLFEVDKDCQFHIIYADAAYSQLKAELSRVFALLPRIQPATYSSRPIAMQFRMSIPVSRVQKGDVAPVLKEKI